MRKIMIGSGAMLLASLIFAYAALTAGTKTQEFSQLAIASQTEDGPLLYQPHCASCHGLNGRAEECYDTSGELIGCAGRALNTRELLCTDETPPRIEAMSWQGDKVSFINQAITVGRPANGMPTFGQQYGGALRDDEIEALTDFVLGWETDYPKCCVERDPPDHWLAPTTLSEFPAGNIANGEQLFNVTYGCAACHGRLDGLVSAEIGPWLGYLATEGTPSHLPNSDQYTAADYIFESIMEPSAHIAPKCPTGECVGPPSSMPDNFGTRMSIQDMSDLLAYILGTDTFAGTRTIISSEESICVP